MNVGLIGLGLMGRGMGHSLLRAGHRLHVLGHRRREALDELVAAGAVETRTAAELASRCDVVVVCLPGEPAVRRVLFDEQGITSAAPPGSLVIDCSTLTPVAGRALAQSLAEQQLAFVDAPVTGGPNEAVEGRLHALTGGCDPDAVTRAWAVLSAFCDQHYAFGGAGRGYAAKLVNNFLAFNNLVAVAEAMATASKADLDLAMLLPAIANGGGQNRCLGGLENWLLGRGVSRSLVTLDTAAKDVDYYCQFATELGTHGPVAMQVHESLAAGVRQGLGTSLTPEYVRHAARRVGVELARDHSPEQDR